MVKILFITLLVSGCANEYNIIRVGEVGGAYYNAEIGNCYVHTTKDKPNGDIAIKYEGEHCDILINSKETK